MPSKKSKVVTIRVSNEVIEKINKRIEGRKSRWLTCGEYVKYIIETEVKRKR